VGLAPTTKRVKIFLLSPGCSRDPVHMTTSIDRRAGSAPAGTKRRLHLVDIENEVAGRVTPESCRIFLAEYVRLGILGGSDLVIVGVSPTSMVATYPLPAGWRRALGPDGPESADIALLTGVPAMDRWSSFSELVIASADHSFLALACQARGMGLAVTIVTNSSRPPHWRLYAAADRHLTLRILPPAESRRVSFKMRALPVEGMWR
jgi:hypothetical protein